MNYSALRRFLAEQTEAYDVLLYERIAKSDWDDILDHTVPILRQHHKTIDEIQTADVDVALSLAVKELGTMKVSRYHPKDFGYTGNEWLMNPHTGSVDTAANWAIDANDWNTETFTVGMQFGELIPVVYDEEAQDWKQI